MGSTLKRAILAIGLGAVLLALYRFLLLLVGGACSNGFYTPSRDALCDATVTSWSRSGGVSEGVVLLLLAVPALSVLVLALTPASKRVLLGVFLAWLALAIGAGVTVSVMAN